MRAGGLSPDSPIALSAGKHECTRNKIGHLLRCKVYLADVVGEGEPKASRAVRRRLEKHAGFSGRGADFTVEAMYRSGGNPLLCKVTKVAPRAMG